ncbi:MAG: DEAD/DEAH box helicase, partial [Halobacteriota archaeon]
MNLEVESVTLVFLHGRRDDVLVEVHAGDAVASGRLELKTTDAGPRPRRFRWQRDDELVPDEPSAIIELCRAADRIRISGQTGGAMRTDLLAMLDAYQLEAGVVRTCPACAARGRYTPLTDETAIATERGELCIDCATSQLERDLTFHDAATPMVAERFAALLERVQDLPRVRRLLEGGLDPELTRIDEIEATTDDPDELFPDELDVVEPLRDRLIERFDRLRPVQVRAVEAGLLDGEDLLVVSATATGKTLIGELTGIDRVLRGEGKLLFLVPLVALANQTYGDLEAAYGDLVDVTIRVGRSRLRDPAGTFDPSADVIVGTYEGVDHALRTGRDLGAIGTVVIDEVHMIGQGERGARLDGLIARLHDYCERGGGDTQWLYLSATVGNPEQLADALRTRLVEYEYRPIPIERHLTFATSSRTKAEVIDRLVTRAFDQRSSKGYRGQSIVFTNARRRCHELSRTLSAPSAAYHGGMTTSQRHDIESRFKDGDIAAVVTTAALGAGVDFPASHVVFESLAMGIDWLSVQEFEQMLGRAGRPDYHDRGVVYMLVEPDGVYHASMEETEDEVAFRLLKGEMEPVSMRYGEVAAIEETLANLVVAGRSAKALNDRMVGELDTT